MLLDIERLGVAIAGTGKPALVRAVSLSVAAGETLCIVGESGCGKSLTSLAIMGLLPPGLVRSAGRLALDGRDLAALPERALEDVRGAEMAMIFQDPMTSLNPSYTIGSQLCEMLYRHRRASRTAARDRAVELLERVGISGAAQRLRQYPVELSGGLRQRVMIAMALMCGPKLLIADEPTTALDVTIQAQILRLLASLQQEMGMGLMLITHDLGVVAQVAHRVVVMYAGEVVESGTVEQVLTRPSHPYTRRLIACIPQSDAPRGTVLETIPGRAAMPTAQPGPGCRFRPRCAEAFAACATVPVPLAAVGEGQASRCLLHAAV